MSRSPRIATSCTKWVSANEDRSGKRTLVVHDIQSHMRDAKSQLNIISIFGKAREGKSFLMNCLAGESNIFRVSNESESCTQGIDISNKIIDLVDFSVLDSGSSVTNPNKMKIMFVDAEGQGDRNTTYDAKLVCPILLISKCVILNWLGGIQKNDILNQLAIMSKAASNVHNVTSDASGEKKFGHLHVVFRDWHYDGNAEAIRRALLNDEPDNEDSRDRNKIRKDIQAAFQSISVHLLDQPTEKTIDSKGILTFDKCTGDFKRQVRDLRHKLSLQLRDPTMFIGMKQPLNGACMCRLVRIITDSLNENNIILPQSAYVSMLSMEIDSKKQQLVDEMEQKLSTFINELERGTWDVFSKVSKATFLVSLEEILKKLEKDLREQVNGYQREMTFLLGKLSDDASMKPRLQKIAKDIDATHISIVNKFKSEYNHVFVGRIRKNGIIIETDLENELRLLEASLHTHHNENSVSEMMNQILQKTLSKITNDHSVKHEEVDNVTENIKKNFKFRQQNMVRMFNEKVHNERSKKEGYDKLETFINRLDAEITEQCKLCYKTNNDGFSLKKFFEQLNNRFDELNKVLMKQLGSIAIPLKDDIEYKFREGAKEKSSFAKNIYNDTAVMALHNYCAQYIKRDLDSKYVDKAMLLRSLDKEGYDLEKEFGKKEPFSTLFINVLDEAKRKLRTFYTSKWPDLEVAVYEDRVVSLLAAGVRDVHQPAIKDMKVLYLEDLRDNEARQMEQKKKEITAQKHALLLEEIELKKERERLQSLKDQIYQDRLNGELLRHDSKNSEEMDIAADTVPVSKKNQKKIAVTEKDHCEINIQQQRKNAENWRNSVLRGGSKKEKNTKGKKSGKSKIEMSDDEDEVVVEPTSKRPRPSDDFKDEKEEIMRKEQTRERDSIEKVSQSAGTTGKGKKRLSSEVATTNIVSGGSVKAPPKSTTKVVESKNMSKHVLDQLAKEEREKEIQRINERYKK